MNRTNKLLPPLNSGIQNVNKLREQDPIFRHNEYLIDKKSEL